MFFLQQNKYLLKSDPKDNGSSCSTVYTAHWTQTYFCRAVAYVEITFPGIQTTRPYEGCTPFNGSKNTDECIHYTWPGFRAI